MQMNYYNTTAQSYTTLHRDEQMHKLQIIKDNIHLNKNARIIDVGCGPCWSAELFPNVTGIDPSEELIKLSKNKQVILGTAENLQFAEKSFDAVLCITAIHHMNVSKALTEIARVAKNNATIVISVLKKSTNCKQIHAEIEKQFIVTQRIDEAKDIILFCRKHT